MKTDRRFEQFIRQCLENPLLKKKGLPECILFVTTRITKYPLLIEPLIKHSKELPAEEEQLKQAINLVRVISKTFLLFSSRSFRFVIKNAIIALLGDFERCKCKSSNQGAEAQTVGNLQ